ncbi:interleukin-1 beta-like [Brienomyrus brachyistius]|uniref:interleukin-1 beta-like n=1 Tax=Brienomyrus brachyistius TaxID=42636 RepID=UPI0020B338D8|nr:interleukin-1 beta-like [Brienomyrus brachyistius]
MSHRETARLITALQRMKDNEKILATEFDDTELICMMVDSRVNEVSVLREPYQTTKIAPGFSLSRTVECSISDITQKSLVLNMESQELLAIALQGGRMYNRDIVRCTSVNRDSLSGSVQLSLSTYQAPMLTGDSGLPTTLRVSGSDLYLCCSGSLIKPSLSLKVVKNKAVLSTIEAESDNVCFLFYKKNTGFSMSSFESVRFPTWFIGTASADRKAVGMCQATAQGHNIHFIVKKI